MFVKTFYREYRIQEVLDNVEGWFRRNSANIESAEVRHSIAAAGYAVHLVIIVTYESVDGKELA